MLTLKAVEGSNKTFELLNEASRVDTPERRPLTVVEKNAEGHHRKVSLIYRPLRDWMKKDGRRGFGLKILSHLQIAGHWAITIGSYTYDVYQDNGAVMFNVGQWCTDCPNESYRVKSKPLDITKKTDMEILAIGMFLSQVSPRYI
jgi:hypothetical protein